MKKNMGAADRIIRAIIGVAIIVFYAASQITISNNENAGDTVCRVIEQG